MIGMPGQFSLRYAIESSVEALSTTETSQRIGDEAAA